MKHKLTPVEYARIVATLAAYQAALRYLERRLERDLKKAGERMLYALRDLYGLNDPEGLDDAPPIFFTMMGSVSRKPTPRRR